MAGRKMSGGPGDYNMKGGSDRGAKVKRGKSGKTTPQGGPGNYSAKGRSPAGANVKRGG